MNLADMLTYADIGQLTAIAGRYECECKRNSKHDLIQSILITLGSREFMESHIRGCTPEELRFLNTLLFDERSHFSLEDLLAAARQACFDTPPVKAAATAIWSAGSKTAAGSLPVHRSRAGICSRSRGI